MLRPARFTAYTLTLYATPLGRLKILPGDVCLPLYKCFVFNGYNHRVGATVYFTWTNNSGNGTALPTDGAVLVAYCEAFNQSVYTTDSAGRSTGSASSMLPVLQVKTIQTWLSFMNEEGTGCGQQHLHR